MTLTNRICNVSRNEYDYILLIDINLISMFHFVDIEITFSSVQESRKEEDESLVITEELQSSSNSFLLLSLRSFKNPLQSAIPTA